MSDKEYLRKFQVLCDNQEGFIISAGVALTAFGLDNGVDELMKYKWYAQISDAILNGDTSSVTDDEKVAFIKLHLTLMGRIKQD